MAQLITCMKPVEFGVFDAQTHLMEIIQRVERGQSFYITREGRRIAEIRPAASEKPRLTRGCAKSENYRMADDFKETPEEFDNYVQ